MLIHLNLQFVGYLIADVFEFIFLWIISPLTLAITIILIVIIIKDDDEEEEEEERMDLNNRLGL